MKTKDIVRLVTYVISAFALVNLAPEAPAEVGVLAGSALANILYVER